LKRFLKSFRESVFALENKHRQNAFIFFFRRDSSMKIVSTIEARMTSTRLPGKTLKPILGKPMLELLVERLRQARKVDEVVIATTVDPSDDSIEELARRMGVGIFRGSMDDVLDRVLKAAQAYKADIIVEMTGDCPLLDPNVVDLAIRTFEEGDYDYVSNIVERTYPRGLDTQVYPTRVLAEVDRKTQDPADRENVSLYIYEHPGEYRLGHFHMEGGADHSGMRLTVDTLEDFQLISRIYELLYPSNPAFTLQDVLRVMNDDQELVKINAHIKQKAVR